MSRGGPAFAALALLALPLLSLAACAGQADPYVQRLDNKGYGYQERANPDGGYTLLVVTSAYGGPDLPRQLFDRRAEALCDHQVASTNTFRADRQLVQQNYNTIP